MVLLDNGVFLDKLTVVQRVNKFPAYYKIRRFITVFTTARVLPPDFNIIIAVRSVYISHSFYACYTSLPSKVPWSTSVPIQ